MKNRPWAHRAGLALGVATLLAAARSVAAPAVPTAPAPPAIPAPDTSQRVLAARVNTFELPAHAAPNTAAPVLHVFTNGALLTVSPDVHDGWRSTRLPDGQTAYLADAGLDFGASPHQSPAVPSSAPAPVQPIVVAPAAPPQPNLYVGDVESLATLVAHDPLVNPMAQHLVTRREAAISAGVAIGVIGAAVLVAGMLDTHPLCAGTFCSGSEPSEPLITTGALLLPIGGLIAVLLYPKRDDLLEVVNTWNVRHLDKQLTVQPIIVSQ